MRLFSKIALFAVSAAVAAPSLALADTYTLANFSGALNSNANIKAPFSGTFFGGEAITGNILIDNSTIPASGLVNVGEASYPDAGIIPPATDFQLNLGSLSFTAADHLNSQFLGGPGIQYLNGAFNGLEFVTNFNFAGSSYQFRIDGQSLTVKLLSGGFVTGNNLMSGKISTVLTNETPFTPGQTTGGVPEPASWALMILGFGAVGALMRRRQSGAFA
jgi:hypothetical protein